MGIIRFLACEVPVSEGDKLYKYEPAGNIIDEYTVRGIHYGRYQYNNPGTYNVEIELEVYREYISKTHRITLNQIGKTYFTSKNDCIDSTIKMLEKLK